jgi:hypothetical protein
MSITQQDILDLIASTTALITEVAGQKTNIYQLITDANNINKAVIPVGSVISIYSDVAPTGFLALDGSLANKTTYSDLLTHVTGLGKVITEADWQADPTKKGLFADFDTDNFRLADCRDDYIGGVGNASVGDWQEDGIKKAPIQTTAAFYNGSSGGVPYPVTLTSSPWSMGVGYNMWAGASEAIHDLFDFASQGSASSNSRLFAGKEVETRPKTIRLLHCIKY